MGKHGRSLMVGAAAAVAVGGLGYVVAGPMDAFGSAGTTTAAAVTTAAAKSASTPTFIAKGAAAQNRRGLARRLLRHSVHASFVIKDGSNGYITVDFDKGAVQSVSSTSITILRPDGVTVTDAVTSSTKFVRTTEASLTKGTKVLVVETGGTAHYVVAPRVGVGGAPSAA